MRMRSERGGGLVEILIAIILVSIVLASMIGVLIQQQRFYMVAGDAANTTSKLQQLETVVTPELLPLNPSAQDVIFAAEDSVVLRAFRGVYWICDKLFLTNAMLVVTSLTNTPPIRADSAMVYSQGTKATVKDDRWEKVRIVSVTDATCPNGTRGWRAEMPALNAVLTQVPLGAPVRAYRPASYWRAAQDGSWALMTDAIGGAPTVISGGLAPEDSTASAILRMVYYDEFGSLASSVGEIEGVEIDLTAIGVIPTKRGGRPLRRDRTVYIRLRNADE